MSVREWSTRQKRIARRMIEAAEPHKEISLRIGRPVSEVETYDAMCRRLETARRMTAQKQTICWDCVNAVPNPETGDGCSWSRKFEPVEGWVARYSLQSNSHTGEYDIASYCVISCPQYRQG